MNKFMSEVSFRNKKDTTIIIHLLLISLGMNSWWIKGVIEIVKIGIFLFV